MMSAANKDNEVKLEIVGGNTFGRYSKISVAETTNMIVSDTALVPYAGYAAALQLSTDGVGRGDYTSTSGDFTVAVVGSGIYLIEPGLTQQLVGSTDTATGDVFIAENNNGEIAISDYVNIYIYSKTANTFRTLSYSKVGVDNLPFQYPGYITFQNSRFLVAATQTNQWFLSSFNGVPQTIFTNGAAFVGLLQTKNDTVQAVVRFPGRGNLLFVFGYTVTESWTDQGLALFPYVKSTSFNLDYGCLNAATIAANENYIVWIAQNEQSGPSLMFTEGSSIQRISTDGIDFKLANLTNPNDCYGFFFRQDGHLIYQFAFPTDNLSYAYDFNTKKFFTVTDENLNYHPAKRVVFFNGVYYFVSNKDGNFYEFDTSQTNYTYSLPGVIPAIVKEIPRIRKTPPLRLLTQQSFVAKNLSFTIENGQPNKITNIPVPQPIAYTAITTESGALITTEDGKVIQTTAFMGTLNYPLSQSGIDLAMSSDGGVTFGNRWRKNMNATGKAKSLLIYRQLGRVNDRSFLISFVGFTRFVAFDGVVTMRK